MIIHEDLEVFQDAIKKTSEMYNIREIYVEKDYWVTLALKEIFSSDINKYCVFKGGTALSKCHKLINRFSEDIDIVVLRNGDESGGSLKKKLKQISTVVGGVMQEVDVEGITNKRGKIRKIAYEYNKVYKGEFGQVRDKIILESSLFGYYEPSTIVPISSLITDMIRDNGLDELLDKYEMHPFEVRVLSKLRTFCEKIMSLVKFSHTENAIEDLSNKIRHIYDLHMMSKDRQVVEFFNGDEFNEMLVRVGKDDVQEYRNNIDWLYVHPSEAIVFSDVEGTWEKINGSYNTTFNELVLGELPLEEDLVSTLEIISKRMRSIEWKLN